jgi:serine/threonine protein kinase
VDDGGRGGGRSRQDHSKSETAKRSKFGNYILGQTLGEGEFGKVKMGWKRDSTVEVAIKLIRRETLGGNSNRLQKIYREIQILRQLDHPNIVRLHEMVETDRHIGIILEYASGGELFDYILNHRYLKDGPARKLFSQLISGVGYLHRKGIVHRDLKLENLLLDRNKNIIITDFGFANTFDPNDELGEEVEYRLGDKDFIKSLGLDGSDASRRGDLMQTSCGSPCYAAPELVVSDSLYTGRKVDVWSCGVILVSLLMLSLRAKSNFYSTPCWLVTYHSTTIQRIPRVITSICSTNISYRHHLHSPNMLHHTPETFLSGYSSQTQESARICSRLHVTAGWPTTHTWLDSSHPATPTRRRPSRLLSTQVSTQRVSVRRKAKLTGFEKTHSSSNLLLQEALPFANPASLTPHRLRHTAASPPNASRSTPHLPKNQRPHATTSEGLCRSNMWHRNRRLNVARHHHRRRPLLVLLAFQTNR